MRRGRQAVGFTVKSGWASAVLLEEAGVSVQLLDVRRVDLCDPLEPKAPQPYHAGYGTAREEGRELAEMVASIERFGHGSVTGLFRKYEEEGHRISCAGAVTGSLIDPARITNPHIRIHALEGRLFRTVVLGAVAELGLPCSVWRDRDLHALASLTLARPEGELRAILTGLGRGVPGPWRREEKWAALAAWLSLRGAPSTVAAG